MKCARSKWAKLLFCCAILLSLMTVSAFAAEEIDELTLSFISPNERPAVGEPIKYMSGGRLTETDDRIELTGNILLWCIDDSSTIINKTYDDTGMYYEAGRTYNAEIVVEVLDPEQYTIGENTKIKLTNPGDFTYTSEVSKIYDTGTSFFADMKLTITMNGARTYPDITKVIFKDLVSPTDGMSVPESNTDIHYNNCMKTSGIWLGEVWGKDQFDNNTFVAGETYTYRVVLTARDGYKFYENATIQLTSGGVDKAPSYYVYTNDYRTLTLDYTYTVPSITWVDCVEATIKRYEQKLTPIAGEAAIDLFTNTFVVDENAPYEISSEMGRTWYSADGTKLSSSDKFEAGKTYYFNYSYSIKDEYRHLYRFDPENLTTTITGESYTGEGFQKAERVEYSNLDNTYVTFRYYFTAQFPAGAGSSAGNPAMCYSYEEFKFAMENDDIRYVALGNVEDTLPVIPHDEEKDPGGVTSTAIVVRGTKDLNLLGDAVFSCPLTGNYDLKYYIQLLTLTDAANSSLYIHGPGSLTYAGGTLNFVNSVIKMEGGHLTVDGATVRGSNGYHTGFCYGINAIFGSVGIQGGATVIGEIYSSEGGISALTLGSEGVDRSLSVSIWDGKFYVERDEGDSDEDHGITVNNDIGLRIYGGSFDGIKLRRYAADTLADYVMDGSVMTVNGVKTDPASCGTTSGIVEVYQEISKVDIHVNAPVAGKSPAMYPEDVYMVPDGVTVNDPVWYKNGQPWNLNSGSERFEAGSTYTVEITLVAGEGVKFANPLTSATINYQDAEVSAFAGNWETGIILTVDLGTCSNTVSEVELTIDQPRKGSTPDLYATIMTNGCQQSVEYGIQWQTSSDGSNWTEMGENEEFSVGKHYRVSINLKAADGNEFATDSNWEPAVSGTVNGKYAEVFRYPEENPDELIFLRCNFGILNDQYIQQIRINDIIEPKAGQKPSYTCTIGGNGYTINTAYNGGSTIDGIYWYDVTDDVTMTPNRTFTLGNQYKVVIDVKTEDGYEFATEKISGSNSYRATGTGYVNGNEATLGLDKGEWIYKEQNVQYIFTCGNQEISTIMLYNLDEPAVGKTPDTQLTSAYPEFYTVTDVTWLDEENNEINKFEAGRLYTVQITVDAKANDGVDSCFFADQVTAYIDGTEVTGWSNKVTTNDDNTVTIRYGFRKPVQAPTVQYYFFRDLPTGGEVFVDEALNVSWSTTFIPAKTEIQYWDGQMWSVWDENDPTGEQDDYDFESDEAASYTFRLVAYVGDDPRAVSSEFTVTWKELVSVVQSGNFYDVTLEKAESGVIVMAAGYQNEQMTEAVCLTVQNPTATLRGDEVKVFFLKADTYAPVRKAIEQ